MREVGVGAAEIMAPFRDAVSFIDCDTGEFALLVNGLEAALKGFIESVFRSNVEEAGVWMTFLEV